MSTVDPSFYVEKEQTGHWIYCQLHFLQGGNLPTLIAQPTRIEAAGSEPKLIDEYIGSVNSKTQSASGSLDVAAGQAVIAHKGEWIQYSTPEGAEYIAVCVPAFSIDTVHRDR